MLCEERGFFLEIADLIRGMGLTILKGVMEARDNKIWARFAVEVSNEHDLVIVSSQLSSGNLPPTLLLQEGFYMMSFYVG